MTTVRMLRNMKLNISINADATGEPSWIESSTRNGMLGIAALEALAWLEEFGSTYGDKLPNSTQIHLPSCLTKETVYQRMAEELKSQRVDVVSYSHFLRLWRENKAHIAIPKVY